MRPGELGDGGVEVVTYAVVGGIEKDALNLAVAEGDGAYGRAPGGEARQVYDGVGGTA